MWTEDGHVRGLKAGGEGGSQSLGNEDREQRLCRGELCLIGFDDFTIRSICSRENIDVNMVLWFFLTDLCVRENIH